MTLTTVRYGLADGVATIMLNRPDSRNALNRAMCEDLVSAAAAAVADDARLVLVRGAGSVFCAGADLKERQGMSDDQVRARRLKAFAAYDAIERLMDTPRPTIAAVSGAVRAGGIGLMAACDLVVVHESVTFALTEVRIGVAAAIISVPILRRVAPGRIATAMLTGAPFDAHDALAMGLVTHVTDDVDATVDALCAGILAGAPRAVAATKELLRTVSSLDRDTAFERMRALSDDLFRGPDAAEGMAAFRDKRQPSWSPG